MHAEHIPIKKWKVRKLNQRTIGRESFDAINHANRSRCKISQLHVGFHMVMPLISNWYIDIHGDIFHMHSQRGSIFETKDEWQSGWFQPCAIHYLLTINWLVLIFAGASLYKLALLQRHFVRSSKNHWANSGQTIISNHRCRTNRKLI